MTLPIATTNDALFEHLVFMLERCDASNGGCGKCPHFATCIRWWDVKVTEYCTHRNLKPPIFSKFMKEFITIRANGDQLARRNREIIRLSNQGKKYREIAPFFNISERQVRKIVNKANGRRNA